MFLHVAKLLYNFVENKNMAKLFYKTTTNETVIYIAFWVVLFAAPVLSLYMRMTSDPFTHFDWREIDNAWAVLAIAMGLFFVHNHFVAPIILYRRKPVPYLSWAAVLVLVYLFALYLNRPRDRHPDMMKLPLEERMHKFVPNADGNCAVCERILQREMKLRPAPTRHRLRRRPPEFRGAMPLPLVGAGELMAAISAVLIMGMNLGVKYYFKSERDMKEMQMLEKQNLEQNLEYLKYQVNPHFFMNTLNNIHALVDIDPEKAKTTIVELSKMMRYILYEGNNHFIPLMREAQFLRNYVMLMRLRYPKKVDITIDIPHALPDMMLPPLLLIIFVENAFKHGISYCNESFVHIELKASGGCLFFSCRNSKNPKRDDAHGGLGLVNVRKRLDLLFADNYSLNIADGPDTYDVKLRLPLAQSK